MESKLSFDYPSMREHFSAKNFYAIGETSSKLSDNENFVFTSGRSIAHMLPPIKPTATEEAEECRIIPPMEIGNTLEVGTETGGQSADSEAFADWTVLDLSQNSAETELTSLQPVVAVAKVMDYTFPCIESSAENSPPPKAISSNLKPTISKDLNVSEVFLGPTISSAGDVPQDKADATIKYEDPPRTSVRVEKNNEKNVNENSIDSRASVQDFLGTYKELDTHLLARKVKDILIENNIGQRIFGQAVLGLTQGSVSDLLSHPKSWQSLSLKGREPFIRMQMWLDNPMKIEEIKNLKSEKTSEHGTGSNKCLSVSSTSGRCGSVSSKKKSRVVLSTDDKLILLQTYASEPYPCQSTVHELAKKLNKQPSTVVNWFHNYRSRVKRGFFACEESKALIQENSGKKSKRDLARNTQQLGKNNRDKSITKTAIDDNKDLQVCAIGKCESKQRHLSLENPKEEDNSSMFIRATVLLSNPSNTISPVWSLHMEENGAKLTSSGAIKNVFFGVCSTDSSQSTTPVVSETRCSTLANGHFEADCAISDFAHANND